MDGNNVKCYIYIFEDNKFQMDPRPVDFSYRRPRHGNLTYQSYGLSQSIYHVGAYSKNFVLPTQNKQTFTVQRSLKANPQDLIHNNSSRWNVKQDRLSKSYIYQNPSTFTNVHTRRPPYQKLSQSMLMNPSFLSGKSQSLIKTTNQSEMYIPNSSLIDKNLSAEMNNRRYSIQKLSRNNIQNEADSLSNWTYSLMKPKPGQLQDKVYEHQQKPYNILNFSHKVEPEQHRQYPRFTLQHKLIQNKYNKQINATSKQ